MRRIAVLVALLAMVWVTPAFASSCPTDMKEIDESLAKGTKLSAANLEKVKKFRAEGEKLHKAGKHKQSIDTLEKAKVILGI
ncbi:MAG: hypothetical protein AUH30_03480 [Candidatus Rokubacteria bacterium 13_1_40CM_68_15]|nr:MAG: hypothetical protein AUH30_03480 [Candidatus Rokubacteria bacterium 13_1_40CM_68_15]